MTPLHELGAFFREQLLSLPLPVVRAVFVGSLLLVLIWVLRLPSSAVKPEGGSGHWDENLKPVAAAALVIQIVIYWLL